MITVTLSSIPDPRLPTNNAFGTAFFKSGSGSIKEMYDFPLSMQTAEPTPVNTNHIWIKNDVKMSLVIDEAIRSVDWGGDNRYYAIVDSTDNNYMLIDSPKKTTDGVPISFVNRHLNRDTAPWVLGSNIQFVKKYGMHYWSVGGSKWPRIMSRYNGVIDTENAKRWDGSAWQWLSQKGHYFMTPNGVFYRNEGTLTTYRAWPNGENGLTIEASLDGNYIARSNRSTNQLDIIKRNGDSFEVVNTFPTGISNLDFEFTKLAFSPDSQYLAACIQDAQYGTIGLVGGGIAIYKKQSNGSWSYLTSFSPNHSNFGVAWNEDGSKLVTAGAYDDDEDGWGTMILNYYTKNGDTFTLTKNIGTGIWNTPVIPCGLAYHGDVVVCNAIGAGFKPTVYAITGGDISTKVILASTSSVVGSHHSIMCTYYLGNDTWAYATQYTNSTSSLFLNNLRTGKLASVNWTNIWSFSVSPDNKYLFLNANGDQRGRYSINISGDTPIITLLGVDAGIPQLQINGNNMACW